VDVMSQVATTVASINASIPNLSVPIGSWMGDREAVYTEPDGIAAVLRDIRQPIYIVINQGRLALASGGTAQLKSESAEADGESLPLLGFIPAVTLSQLGDAGFCGDHGIRYAYMTGAMANGIASVELVQAAAKGAVLGSYGAAGQSIELVSSAIDRLLGPEAASSDTDASSGSSGPPHPGICFNLIHSPNEQEHEAAVVDLSCDEGFAELRHPRICV
jgi:trans-AT polyketide synthase/acyltransferase/oxidoreductase domain-containing protein